MVVVGKFDSVPFLEVETIYKYGFVSMRGRIWRASGSEWIGGPFMRYPELSDSRSRIKADTGQRGY